MLFESSRDQILTKKIITVLGLSVRESPGENVNLLLNKIMEFDDGAPLSPEKYEKLKKLVDIQ